MKKLISLFKRKPASDFSGLADSDIIMLAKTEFKNDYQYAYFWMKNNGTMPVYKKHKGEAQ